MRPARPLFREPPPPARPKAPAHPRIGANDRRPPEQPARAIRATAPRPARLINSLLPLGGVNLKLSLRIDLPCGAARVIGSQATGEQNEKHVTLSYRPFLAASSRCWTSVRPPLSPLLQATPLGANGALRSW